MAIKVCRSCNIEKLLSDFRRDPSKLDGRRPICKVCNREQDKRRYDSGEKHKVAKRSQSSYQILRQHMDEYKKDKKCCLCPESEAICLEFHHVDPSKKDFTIGSKRSNWPAVLAEISKCVILCSNCHNKVHAGIIALIE